MNNKNNNTTPYAGLLEGANPVMAVGSALLVLAFIVFTVADPEYADGIYTAAKNFIATDLGWYYIGIMSFFLFFLSGWCSAATVIFAWAVMMTNRSSVISPGFPCCLVLASELESCSGVLPNRFTTFKATRSSVMTRP